MIDKKRVDSNSSYEMSQLFNFFREFDAWRRVGSMLGHRLRRWPSIDPTRRRNLVPIHLYYIVCLNTIGLQVSKYSVVTKILDS